MTYVLKYLSFFRRVEDPEIRHKKVVQKSGAVDFLFKEDFDNGRRYRSVLLPVFVQAYHLIAVMQARSRMTSVAILRRVFHALLGRYVAC
jgi:hypothetical protein